jgi:hypothetical protein
MADGGRHVAVYAFTAGPAASLPNDDGSEAPSARMEVQARFPSAERAGTAFPDAIGLFCQWDVVLFHSEPQAPAFLATTLTDAVRRHWLGYGVGMWPGEGKGRGGRGIRLRSPQPFRDTHATGVVRA